LPPSFTSSFIFFLHFLCPLTLFHFILALPHPICYLGDILEQMYAREPRTMKPISRIRCFNFVIGLAY
jgi:hypothetical protein